MVENLLVIVRILCRNEKKRGESNEDIPTSLSHSRQLESEEWLDKIEASPTMSISEGNSQILTSYCGLKACFGKTPSRSWNERNTIERGRRDRRRQGEGEREKESDRYREIRSLL